MLHGITYGDAVDLFAVEFTSRECVLGGRSYPLGFFVAEALDKIPNIVEFRSSVAHMKEEQRGISDRQRTHPARRWHMRPSVFFNKS